MTLFIGYPRVSGKEQAEHGHSLDEQRRRLTEFFEHKGWEYEIREEPAISAWREGIEGRPVLQGILRDVESGRVGGVFVTKWDRLSRRLRVMLQIIDTFQRARIKYGTLGEIFDHTNPRTKLHMQIEGAFAEYDNATRIDNFITGKQGAARKGLWPTGPVVYGYRRGADKRLVVHEPEAAVVQMIFSLLLERGMGVREIVRELRARGIPTVRGRWSRSMVRKILTNETYVGRAYVNRYTGDGKARQERPRDQWILVPAPHVVSDETFAQAQTRLPRISELAEGKTTREYLLRTGGLLRCACGRRMFCIPRRASARYQCSGRDREVYNPPCRAPSRRAKDLDAIVWDQVAELLRDPDLILAQAAAWRASHVTDRDALEMELQGINASLARLVGARGRILDAFEDGFVDKDEMRHRLAGVDAKVAQLRERQAAITAQLEGQQADEQQAASLRDVVDRFAQRLDTLSFEERREVVHAFVDRVTVHADGRVDVTAAVPAPDGGGERDPRHTIPTVWPPAPRAPCACRKRSAARSAAADA